MNDDNFKWAEGPKPGTPEWHAEVQSLARRMSELGCKCDVIDVSKEVWDSMVSDWAKSSTPDMEGAP